MSAFRYRVRPRSSRICAGGTTLARTRPMNTTARQVTHERCPVRIVRPTTLMNAFPIKTESHAVGFQKVGTRPACFSEAWDPVASYACCLVQYLTSRERTPLPSKYLVCQASVFSRPFQALCPWL